MGELLARAESLTGRSLSLTEEARTVLLAMADGDGRYLLGMVEQILAAQDAGGCLPGGVERRSLYEPTANGHERHIRERLEYWKGLRARKREKGQE